MDHSFECIGNNISLVPLKEKNIQVIREWRNQDHIRKCFVNSSFISEEQQIAWYNSYLHKIGDYVFEIHEQSFNKIIGMCALYNVSNDSAEFGRFIIGDVSAHGKGYGVEAVRLALSVAFEKIKLDSVRLEVYSDNIPAIKIYEKCGFNNCGLNESGLYDMIIFRKEYLQNA